MVYINTEHDIFLIIRLYITTVKRLTITKEITWEGEETVNPSKINPQHKPPTIACKKDRLILQVTSQINTQFGVIPKSSNPGIRTKDNQIQTIKEIMVIIKFKT